MSKVTITLEDDVRARKTKNGILIDVPFFISADVIRAEFKESEEFTIDDILPDGVDGRLIHWKLSGDKWNALVKAKLAPTWYGMFTCDIHNVKANAFVDKDGNDRISLTAAFRPIKSEEGVAIGTTNELEVIDARGASEESTDSAEG